MKFGIRKFSFRKRIASRFSLRRHIVNSLGLKTHIDIPIIRYTVKLLHHLEVL